MYYYQKGRYGSEQVFFKKNLPIKESKSTELELSEEEEEEMLSIKKGLKKMDEIIKKV